MTAQQAKQVVKNALYRTIGETSTALRLRPDGQKTLSILMYHKVNDLPDNPTTVPVWMFDEQLGRLGELGYNVVDLDAVLDHYTLGKPLPEKAVLITFDDGYRDTLENALPVLQKHGYHGRDLHPGRLHGGRDAAAARDAPARARDAQPDARLGADARARRRRRARRVARDRPPAARRGHARRGRARDRRLEAEARGAARPPGAGLRLRQGLGGALPPRAREHPQAGGLRDRVHLDLACQRHRDEPVPARALQRRALPVADVRPRALRRLRPDLAEGHRRRHARAAAVQPGARHVHAMERGREGRRVRPLDGAAISPT